MRALTTGGIGLYRDDLDLTRASDISRVLDRLDPAVVINCAAFTDVDQAEKEEALATQINGTAVGSMAAWCQERSTSFLTFSTDYVFDGTSDKPYLESSRTEPINAYGRSKLVGERLALQHDALVVRTSWVLSGTHPNFVATMIGLIGERTLSVVDDQRGCPTMATDLAVASYLAVNAGVKGLLHLTNQGPTTWYELAVAAIEEAGLPSEGVIPCFTEDYPTPAARPKYSVLGSERLTETPIPELPHWKESLPGVVAEIRTWI